MEKNFENWDQKLTGDQVNILYCANQNFRCREVAGEIVLIPLGEELERFNGIAALNESGKFLWDLLSTKQTFSDLVKHLAQEYELTFERSYEDVDRFLQIGLKQNMILQC